ncbi:MAG TPA: hypothetical protein VN132_14880 [Bdellovibrio sp.]|nr:hypothetical protein [Bdellovibrio sp.]
MSEENTGSPIIFPWNGVLPSQDPIYVRDLDVVGVGALRRQQIESWGSHRQIILQSHEAHIPPAVHAVYDEELLRTLHWLRPWQMAPQEHLNLLEEHQKTFSRLFPLTEKALGLMASRVRDSYLAEMTWNSWLLQDHWRYFVGFLRKRFPQNQEILDLAYWEWVQAWLEIQPFDLQTNSDSGILTLNPSLQIVPLSSENSLLQRALGIYAFVFSSRLGRVVERSLTPAEALLVDLLNEERKYTSEQLLEMATLSNEPTELSQANEGAWRKKLQNLLETDLVFKN